MRTTLSLILSILLPLAVFSQNPAKIIINTEGDVHPWNHLNVNNGEETFQFAIVTDRTGGLRRGIFPDAVKKLNLLQPEFVMSVGDLISGYTEDIDRINKEWEEFTGFIDDLKMPFFYVPGNHDYINEIMAAEWKRRFGKDYYHFVYKDVLFLCLNSEEKIRGAGKGYIDEPQLAYIDAALKENPDVRWTLLFLHQPLWDQEDNGKWPEVEQLLEGRKHTVFAGHRHRYVKYDRNDSKYFILATTGGGSRLRGPRFGEFDHVVWITMTNDGPIMANLMLDGIWDENVNTEGMHTHTQELLALQPLEYDAMLMDAASFSGGEWEIRLNNNSDLPMKAEVAANSTGDIWLAMDKFEKILEPNTVETVKIPMKTEKEINFDEINPIEVQVSMTYQADTYPELEINQNINLKPVPWNRVSPASGKIKVDGNLKEWGILPNQPGRKALIEADPFSHSGPEDCSFAFATRYGKEYLYVGLKVTDDMLEAPEGSNPMNQDVFGVFLDARPLGESTGPQPGRIFNDNLLIAVQQPFSENPEIFQQNRLPEGISVATAPFTGGYTAEIAIPLTYLNDLQEGDWEYFRLNIVVVDSDRQGDHQSTLFWQPDWRGENNILGSGMFKKSE